MKDERTRRKEGIAGGKGRCAGWKDTQEGRKKERKGTKEGRKDEPTVLGGGLKVRQRLVVDVTYLGRKERTERTERKDGKDGRKESTKEGRKVHR